MYDNHNVWTFWGMAGGWGGSLEGLEKTSV